MTTPSRGPRKMLYPVDLPPGMTEPLISLAAHEGGLPLRAIFGREAPLEIEVGTGRGTTLRTLSQRFPETNFLGIEMGFNWARLTRGKLVQAGLTNARVVAGEAQWVMERYLPERVARCVHVYFPDPWPKNRHSKRRLFRPGFPDLLRRCLTKDGEVRLATDHEDYFHEIRAVLNAGCFVEDQEPEWPEEPVSSFEAKYRAQGRAIYRAIFRP